jgi:hypothetical protein
MPRSSPDDGCSPVNYPSLNEAFYDGDPADYFMRRFQGLLLLRGNAAGIEELLRAGVTAGSLRLQLSGGADPGSEAARQDAEARHRFITADAWLLLHHASETVLRLYLAHREGHPCPPLQMARHRRDFKRDVAARFRKARRTPAHFEANGSVFYGSPTAGHVRHHLDEEQLAALLSNIEDLLRMFADVFLDAEAYNAVKHGMAVQPGHSRFTITVDDRDLGQTQGPHIEYLGTRMRDGRKVWLRSTKWIDLDIVFQQIYVAHRMITTLWTTARHRYLGAPFSGLLRLDQPAAAELLRSDAITWNNLSQDLIYETPPEISS